MAFVFLVWAVPFLADVLLTYEQREIQVLRRQAEALERIADRLDGWALPPRPVIEGRAGPS